MLSRPKPVHVLVVDDDADLRFVVETLLEDEGYTVTTAENGVQALRAVAVQPPDIVVLDLLMPIFDGCDVLAELREHRWRTPVVVVSGVPYAEEQVRSLGADAVITKPFDAADLLATVAALAPDPGSVGHGPRDSSRIEPQ